MSVLERLKKTPVSGQERVTTIVTPPTSPPVKAASDEGPGPVNVDAILRAAGGQSLDGRVVQAMPTTAQDQPAHGELLCGRCHAERCGCNNIACPKYWTDPREHRHDG